MMRRLSCAVLTALLVPMWSAVRPALADTPVDRSTLSAFAVRMPVVLAPRATSDPAATSAVASEFAVAPPDERSIGATDSEAEVRYTRVSGTRYESRYRPRRERYHGRGPWRGRGVSQVHAGFLDPEGPSEAGFLAGFRGGQRIDDAFEIGLGLDWRNKSGRTTELLQETIGPGGERITVRRAVSSFSSNLFPALLYLQISGPSHLTLVPYAGAAASWQVLFLQADDFATGQTFDATFDGFGWQAWAGAALPLSGRSRLIGEVFMNQADLNRDVFDPALGQDIRETVNVDGVGARFGMSWGF
ncbi:MAG: hypothetical protein ACRENJ_04540 [Candidatus Eiseniibacteriota bacterium]